MCLHHFKAFVVEKQLFVPIHPKQNASTADKTHCTTYAYANLDIYSDMKHSSILLNEVAKMNLLEAIPHHHMAKQILPFYQFHDHIQLWQ